MLNLVNIYHPRIWTRARWDYLDEAAVRRSGETRWAYIQRRFPRRAKAILRRMDDSQAEAVQDA